MADIQIDESALSADAELTEPVRVEEPKLVFVPFADFEIRVNQDVIRLRKGVAVRLDRDKVRIALENEKGYVKE